EQPGTVAPVDGRRLQSLAPVGAGARSAQEAAGREPSRLCSEPSQFGDVVPIAGRLPEGLALVTAVARSAQEAAGREPSRLCSEPLQPGQSVPGHERAWESHPAFSGGSRLAFATLPG